MPYAIRDKRTKLYAPLSRGTTRGRGGTWVEPSVSIDKARFWTKLKDARGWLTVWLKGTQRSMISVDYFGVESYTIETTPVPERMRENMEIIEIKFVEGDIVQ
jgi:hypothetical protein